LGDGVQAIKSGLLEIGDIVVVNKADQPGADDAQRVLQSSFDLAHSDHGRPVPILVTVAVTSTGTAELLQAIDDHFAWLAETGQRPTRQERRARAEVLVGLRAALEQGLEAGPGRSPELTELISRVVRRELSPRQAVDTLTEMLGSPINS
jgi:LAO/AO transport system kinase